MFEWINKIFQFTNLGKTRFFQNIFLSSNSLAFYLQFIGLLMAFGCNILLARLYGDRIYGMFSLVTGWAILFSVFGLFGMDDRHLARIPSLHQTGEGDAIKRELIGSLKINILTATLSVLLFFLVIRFARIALFSENMHYFMYSLMLIPAYVLMNNLLYFLRAMKWIVKGEIADKLIRPLAFAMFVFLFYLLCRHLTPSTAIIASGAGLGVVILTLSLFSRTAIQKMPRKSNGYPVMFNFGTNFRYTFLNFLYLLSIRLDILLLGIFVSASQVGHYTMASRYGDIFSYPVAMLNLSFPALISEKIHQKNEQEASLLSFNMAKNAFWLCLATGIIFIFISPWVFSLYGKSFEEATRVLPIFFLATLVNASCGLSDVFFIVTGRERKVIICRIISLVVAAFVAALLIPMYNLEGAAWSVLAGNTTYYLLLQVYYWRIFGQIVNPFTRPRNIFIS